MRILFLSIFYLSFLFAQTGQEILKKVDESAFEGASYSLVLQKIKTSKGKEREFLIKIYQKDYGKKILFRYVKPARIKGTSFLFTEQGIWAYFPKTGRIRRIASKAKKERMMGSGFTYEDISMSGNFSDNYSAKLLRSEVLNGEDTYVLELIPKKESSYSKLIVWARKKDYIPLFIEFYNKENKLIKKLREEKIEIIDGQPTPMRIILEDLEENSETIMEFKEVKYSISLPDDFFTLRELEKGK